ncbi:MAG: hypothetical protein QNJ12_21985 [Ilumatobacter sp.]|uniref:hypothetical protein n=1 Tax=Ilumatobacter sp. TaxID=1967498 RepID=UPI002606B0ED|nr:hypothetical protein [Ilumatobacter sp.]MDJ0771472.1 hypothetical protein [Ilumatobacter sp.]
MGQQFGIRYDAWCRPLMAVLAMGRRFSRVEVTPDEVRVVMGWAFRASIPRPDIAAVAHGDRRLFGWGVHGWRSRWLVNGSRDGIVKLTIEPAARSRMMGIPIKLKELWVSLEEPDRFIATVAPR